MGARTSMWLEVIEDHSDTLLSFERKSELVSMLEHAKTEGEYLYIEFSKYGFDVSTHNKYSNKHVANMNSGCGCAYCRKRWQYTRSKIKLHRERKNFENYIDFYEEKEFSTLLEEFKKREEELDNEINNHHNELKKIEFVLNSMGYTNL
jgi:hypothetical protein